MAYMIRWIDDERGVVSSFSGSLTDADLRQNMQQCVADAERFGLLNYAVTDFTDVDKVRVSSPFIIANAGQAVSAAERNRHLCFGRP